MAASIWASFPNYPREDQMTVCERNGNLMTVDYGQAAEKLKVDQLNKFTSTCM